MLMWQFFGGRGCGRHLSKSLHLVPLIIRKSADTSAVTFDIKKPKKNLACNSVLPCLEFSANYRQQIYIEGDEK